jgi:hypothetical protein
VFVILGLVWLLHYVRNNSLCLDYCGSFHGTRASKEIRVLVKIPLEKKLVTLKDGFKQKLRVGN